MREFFGGMQQFESSNFRPLDEVSVEKQSELEACINEIDLLIAEIVERSTEKQKDVIQSKRSRLKQLIWAVGQVTGNELYGIEDLAKVYDWTHAAIQQLKPPVGHFSAQELDERLLSIVNASIPSKLPVVEDTVHADDIAQYAQADWKHITGRGQMETLDYLHNLGIIMHYPLAYHALFTDDDAIAIDDHWNVCNGRHRSFLLRAFGEPYVQDAHMNEWINITHSE